MTRRRALRAVALASVAVVAVVAVGRAAAGGPIVSEARMVEVELGLQDGLIRVQTVEITSGAEVFGSGLEQVRTVYRVEYWAHGETQEVREPE